jgi:hypothetical protein
MPETRTKKESDSLVLIESVVPRSYLKKVFIVACSPALSLADTATELANGIPAKCWHLPVSNSRGCHNQRRMASVKGSMPYL